MRTRVEPAQGPFGAGCARAVPDSDFRPGRDVRFGPRKTVVARCGPNLSIKHLFAACLHVHRNGQMLLVCRWDRAGEAEGDATNEQALYFSRDGGASWELAGGGALIGMALGSSFKEASSITHGWVDEDRSGRTWIYYTVNQPFTWGEGRPDRSTGGGEIRREELAWKDDAWRLAGPSEIVWAYRRSLPDGRGGRCGDIRTVAWNGILRLRRGSAVMAVGGRSTTDMPAGTFARLDRVWVLISRDDGRTWNEAHFVAGGESLCVAEPTIVETSRDGELVCLLRVQYDTGDQLHRTMSSDGGLTWSTPVPTGLPQCDRQGVKPYLRRTRDGRYVLIQTNEHESNARTNLAVFFTDEAGLRCDRWPVHRTLHIGHRSGWWSGSCYGWLAEDLAGTLWATWTCHDVHGGALYVARLEGIEAEEAPGVEPNGVADEHGDRVPRLCDPLTPAGERSFRFEDVRGRLTAPRFGLFDVVDAIAISVCAWVVRPPEEGAFRLFRLTRRNGRDESGALLCDQDGWRWRDEGGADTEVRQTARTDGWARIRCVISRAELRLELDGDEAVRMKSDPCLGLPTGLQFGGGVVASTCEILLGEFTYRVEEGPCA